MDVVRLMNNRGSHSELPAPRLLQTDKGVGKSPRKTAGVLIAVAVLTVAPCRADAVTPERLPEMVDGPNMAARALPTTTLPKQIVTRQQEFAIPYRMAPDHLAREVRLFVSSDQGRTWRLISRAEPHVHSFRYRAPQDGEYWFAIRTLHDRGRYQPAGLPRAELRVVVDTRAPRLDLFASRGGDGEVKVGWRVVDPNLKPDSLKIETRSSEADAWQPLAIGRPQKAIQATRTGEARFWPNAGARRIMVRAEISDWAGNRNVSQTEVAVTDMVSNQGGSALVSLPAGNTVLRRVPPIGDRGAASHPLADTLSDGSQIWPPDETSARPLGQKECEPRGLSPR